jgi:glycopeptide antibiotics resistance protein
MAIEISQLLLCRGVFELDDILGNVIGGIIGLGYALCVGVRFGKKSRKQSKTDYFMKYKESTAL